VDVNQLALEYSATLPMWVLEELVEVPETFESDEDKMRLVNVLARRNYREGTGGPFAALVIDSNTGELVSAGVNLVLNSGLSSSHAEVVALSLAQTRIGNWDLGADPENPRELVVNWRPCVQCYGAVMWSGVKRLVVAGDGPELEHLTRFDEGPMVEDWADQFESRGIEVVQDVLRDEAIEVYREYGSSIDSGEVTVYNARGTGPTGD
jgi:tRNA(Arg) A34 adenosine deaminase TadA